MLALRPRSSREHGRSWAELLDLADAVARSGRTTTDVSLHADPSARGEPWT